MEDKLVADTEDKKNELESFIYELRAKIDDQYAEFANDEEKARVKEKLEQSEVRLVMFLIEVFFLIGFRIGCTTKAKIRQRLYTSARLKRLEALLVQSSNVTTIKSRKSDKLRKKRKRKLKQLREQRRMLKEKPRRMLKRSKRSRKPMTSR